MKTKYVLSLSFGKDSLALLLEIIRQKLPLDYVVFCDIKFTKDISGEHPLMNEWIKKFAENKVNNLLYESGYECFVQHITYKKTFCEQFYTAKLRGKHIGDKYGFPYVVSAWCNSRLKLEPIRNFISKLIKQNYCVYEYIGIALDEQKRLERYKTLEKNNHKYITLADFNITEIQAMELVKQYDLLSPKYQKSFRGGCWFCPKQCMWDLYCLWNDYPDYFNYLEQMESDSHNTFKPNKTLNQIRTNFENGKTPKKKK